MKDLFDFCEFGKFNLQSRVIRTGLWESENLANKQLTPEILERYEKIASSGVGLITTELISIYPHDGFSPYSHSINSPTFINDFKELVHTCHIYDVPLFAQIGFVRYNDEDTQDKNVNDLSVSDIRKIQTDLYLAVKKSSFAKFDGVQINLGNFYYLSRFLNPNFNQRNDKFGGSVEGRCKIITDVIQIIKDEYDLHINCRINVDNCVEIGEILQNAGADSIQITKPRSPQYFQRGNKKNDLIKDASKASKMLDIPVILGGGFDNQNELNKLLNQTDINFVSMQRPFVCDPYFLLDWRVDGNGVSRCKTCNNCYWKKTSTCHIY